MKYVQRDKSVLDGQNFKASNKIETSDTDPEFWKFFSPFSTFFTKFRASGGGAPNCPPPGYDNEVYESDCPGFLAGLLACHKMPFKSSQ